MQLKLAPYRPRPAPRGFTLVELMIAVVVVALLATIALPSFMDSIRKSRRSEAFAALMAVQQAQERWRGNHGSYASSVTAAAADDGLGLPGVTASGYYAIALDADTVGPDGYTATAVAQDGTSQAADTACRELGVRMAGGNLTYAGGSGDLVYAATHPCWAK